MNNRTSKEGCQRKATETVQDNITAENSGSNEIENPENIHTQSALLRIANVQFWIDLV